MSEDTTTEAGTATEETTTEQATQGTDSGTETVDWKAKAREWEKRAKENKDAALKLQELEDAKKTETEKLTDKLTTAAQQRDQLASEAMKLRIALRKGVPADLIDRLRGETEEEVEADADALLALVAPKDDSTAPGPRPDLSQGSSGNGATALNGDPLLNDLKSKLGIR